MAPRNSQSRRAGGSEATGPGTSAPLQGGIITALTPQRRPGRRSLFLDGRFACGLSEAVLQELRWQVGRAVSAGDLAAALAAEQAGAAREAALRYLTAVPRSRQEVLRRLERRGFPPAAVEATLQWLEDHGLLDDASLAQRFAASLQEGRRPVGRASARRKLAARGLHGDLIEAAVTSAYGSDGELSAARAAAAHAMRRLASLAKPVAERRLGAALQRRGFGYETIRQVLRENLGDGESS